MNKENQKIQKIYNVLVEEPDGYYYVAEGVLLVDGLGKFTLFCTDSRHNFLRGVLQKYRFNDLSQGITYREHRIKTEDLTERFIEKYDDSLDSLPNMLQELLDTAPRHYHFLKRFLAGERQQNPFGP